MQKYNGSVILNFEIQAENAREAMRILNGNIPETSNMPNLTDINVDISEQSKKLLIQEQQRIYNKYPDTIMGALREAHGLDQDDISHDEEINHYSPSEVFEELLNFEGYIHSAYKIKAMIQKIYGINIDNIGESLDKVAIYPSEIDEQDLSPIQAYVNAITSKNQLLQTQQEFEK